MRQTSKVTARLSLRATAWGLGVARGGDAAQVGGVLDRVHSVGAGNEGARGEVARTAGEGRVALKVVRGGGVPGDVAGVQVGRPGVVDVDSRGAGALAALG